MSSDVSKLWILMIRPARKTRINMDKLIRLCFLRDDISGSSIQDYWNCMVHHHLQ
jgi:hypothetical protein